MARRTVDITISDEGRDKGKVFRLTEMPASQAEKWAARAFLAMARSGIAIPQDVANAGLAGLASMGLLNAIGKISFEDATILLDEMFTCVAAVPSPNVVRSLIEVDIEEISTRLLLRKEVFNLHTGFFTDAAH